MSMYIGPLLIITTSSTLLLAHSSVWRSSMAGGLSAEVITRMQSGLWPSWILIGGSGEESFSKFILGRIQFLATVGFKPSLLWRVAPSVIKKAVTCQSNSSHVLNLWLLVLQLAQENALLLKGLRDQVRPPRQSPFWLTRNQLTSHLNYNYKILLQY